MGDKYNIQQLQSTYLSAQEIPYQQNEKQKNKPFFKHICCNTALKINAVISRKLKAKL